MNRNRSVRHYMGLVCALSAVSAAACQAPQPLLAPAHTTPPPLSPWEAERDRLSTTSSTAPAPTWPEFPPRPEGVDRGGESEFSYSEGAIFASQYLVEWQQWRASPPPGWFFCAPKYQIQSDGQPQTPVDMANDQNVVYWVAEDGTIETVDCKLLHRLDPVPPGESATPPYPTVPPPTPKPTPRPTPKPTPTATPKPAGLPGLGSGPNPALKPLNQKIVWFRVAKYFSPNADESKDTARIDVVATPDIGTWELTVEGYPGYIRRDSGTVLNYKWDGKINGVPLPEGKHRLKLTAAGVSPRYAETILDVTPPEVTELKITDIVQRSGTDELDYTMTFNAVDKPKYFLGSGPGTLLAEVSGLDKSSPKLDPKQTNAEFKYVSREEDQKSDKFKLVENCRLGNISELRYTVAAQDRAGNTGVAREQLAEDIGFAGVDERSIRIYNGIGYPTSAACAVPMKGYGLQNAAIGAGAVALAVAVSKVLERVGPQLSEKGLKELLALIALITGATATATTLERDQPGFCTVPAADRAIDPTIPQPEWNTPFVYPGPGGRPLRYHTGFLNVDRQTGNVSREQINMTLEAMVMIVRQETNQVVYATPMLLDNLRMQSPMVPTRYFDWDGRSNSGVELPSGKYKVRMAVAFGRNGVPHDSPTVPNVQFPSRWPIGYRGLPAADKRLHGIRVINNDDGRGSPFLGPNPYTLIDAYEKDWKSFMGPAGMPLRGNSVKTHDWHHIVEENQLQFPVHKLVSTYNLVRLEKLIHTRITAFYNQPQPYYQTIDGAPVDEEMKLRDWLRKHYDNSDPTDFEFQHELGLRILRDEYNWMPPMQGD